MADTDKLIEVLEDGVGKYLDALIDRAETKQRTFIRRVIYPLYQKAQEDRWESKNNSEGTGWVPLNPDYEFYKRKHFISYPGQGKVMMVATGKLFASVRGPSQGKQAKIPDNEGISFHRPVFGNDYMEIYTTLPYAKEASDKRPVMTFTHDTIQEWVDKFREWLNSGKE